MNRDQQDRGGSGGGGSVKRARERAAAGLPQQYPGPTPSQSSPRPIISDAARANPGTPPSFRARQALPGSLLPTRPAPSVPIGVAISRPTPVPQWPLPTSLDNSKNGRIMNQRYIPPAGRGPAPQRPPRPSNVPSMLDASRVPDPTPSFQYRPQAGVAPQRQPMTEPPYAEDPTSPDVTSPLSAASRPSTVSSVGEIPDFPMPIPATSGPARRASNRSSSLGPPPSSRRGASSYYSNASYVSPIPEESPRTGRSYNSYNSFASSAAIPSTWGGDDSLGFDDDGRNTFSDEDIIEEGRETESRTSNGEDNDERGLVRSASIGKRAKPSVVNTKGTGAGDASKPPVPQISHGPLGGGGLSAALSGRPSPSPLQQDRSLAQGTGWLDGASSSSSETVNQIARGGFRADDRTPSSSDLRGDKILGDGAGTPQGDDSPPERSFSRLSAMRRPPRLDMNAVREMESRGSMTSLPDLIKRATRLAALIDKGKRPGSRLNMLNDFLNDGDGSAPKEVSDEKRGSSLSGMSGMLAAFPPPGLATPPVRDSNRGSPAPSPESRNSFPSPYQPSTAGINLDKERNESQRRRRCCGLPVWGFLILAFILALIIAAAVVVPIEILIVHKQQPESSPSALAACQQTLLCENGGTNVLSIGVCSCICANGFTGDTCTVAGSVGCTTTSIQGSTTTITNVTLGQAIPRLLDQAQANFSIPLNSEVIIASFNTANFSCDTENALVTFDGFDTRMGDAESVVISSAASTVTPAPQIQARQTGYLTSGSGTIQTVDPSIIFDTSTRPGGTPTGTAAAPTSTNFEVTEEVLDFSRVAVLYVLQEQQLNAAITAQGNIQKFLSSGASTGFPSAANLSLGGNNSVDFITLSVNVGQGNVGGTAGGGLVKTNSTQMRMFL